MALRIYFLARWCHLPQLSLLPASLKTLKRIFVSVVLPPSAHIERNVVFSYNGLGLIISKDIVSGYGVTIGKGVTIGERSGQGRVTVIAEGAMVGTGAKVHGSVRIGRYASIGANAVVLSDVPDYGVAVGIPARVIRVNRPEDVPDYRAFQQTRDAA